MIKIEQQSWRRAELCSPPAPKLSQDESITHARIQNGGGWKWLELQPIVMEKPSGTHGNLNGCSLPR